MIIPFVTFFFIALNPLTILVMSKIVSAGEASRLIWCMMGPFVIAFAITDSIIFLKEKYNKNFFFYGLLS